MAKFVNMSCDESTRQLLNRYRDSLQRSRTPAGELPNYVPLYQALHVAINFALRSLESDPKHQPTRQVV